MPSCFQCSHFSQLPLRFKLLDTAPTTVFTGITVALPLGKAIGIAAVAVLLDAWVANESRLPLDRGEYLGVSLLVGIGFTVCLLIANLAFTGNDKLLAEATLGVILGSLISMFQGAIVIKVQGGQRMTARKEAKKPKNSK